MEKPISVGDLVMVVKSCCDDADALGEIFLVAGIREKGTRCRHCFQRNNCAHAGSIFNFTAGVPLSWLKRIPPLSELETKRTADEVTA